MDEHVTRKVCPTGRFVEQLEGSPSDAAVNCSTRRWIGVGVISILVVLAEIAHLTKTGDVRGALYRLVFLAVYVPIHIFVISSAYDFTLRRRYGPLRTIGFTGGVSMMSAMALMATFWGVFQMFPSIRSVIIGADKPLHLTQALAIGAMMGPMHLAVWVLAFVYPFAAHDARARALEAEKLRTAAELARLRGHLEPHFILNTLNAIAGLVTEEPREARRLLGNLGDLLRDALLDDDEMRPLADEEAWLRRYASILESRHKGSLCFDWDIDPSVKGVLVPALLLQPLVENAVKHGALRRREWGVVTVRARRSDDGTSVVCTVDDNGPGFPEGPIRQGALGLHMVRRRLELKYKRASLQIESSTEGTRAIVEFAQPTAAAHPEKHGDVSRPRPGEVVDAV